MTRLQYKSLPLFVPILLGWFLLLQVQPCWSQKIAIIGGGVAGTFTAKYLTDYDQDNCLLDSITLFDPNPIGSLQDNQEEWQGSRVAAVQLPDGKVVELGASVFHQANRLLHEMIANDPELTIGKPFNVGPNDANKVPTRVGLGIYDGEGEWTLVSNNTNPWNKFWVGLRYNWDLYKVDKATKQAINLFANIPALLNSTHPDTFFETPDQLWAKADLIKLVHVSFDQLLDALWVSQPDSFWTQHLPYQGSLRRELLTAINLINYNQPNRQINALVGLASFAASQGPLYSLVGGNPQMIKSAVRQARAGSCPNTTISHQPSTITTVIGSEAGFELFAGDTLVGQFDTVVLAAPLQQSRIQFLIPSPWDGAVLQSMPLMGKIDPSQEGHDVLPTKLPGCATRPYTQVVTTVVSQATLNHEHFQLESADQLPRAVCTTERGKLRENNITVVSQIAGDGVYKVFSSGKLNEKTLGKLFGPHHKVEYVKIWGGPHGGATPDYQGQGTTVPFLLYDGATGLEGHTTAGGLYYPNAIETALACMEASAIGAKAVAKLVARRLGLLTVPDADNPHDEL